MKNKNHPNVYVSYSLRSRRPTPTYFNRDLLSGHRLFHFAVHERVVYAEPAEYRKSLKRKKKRTHICYTYVTIDYGRTTSAVKQRVLIVFRVVSTEDESFSSSSSDNSNHLEQLFVIFVEVRRVQLVDDARDACKQTILDHIYGELTWSEDCWKCGNTCFYGQFSVDYPLLIPLNCIYLIVRSVSPNEMPRQRPLKGVGGDRPLVNRTYRPCAVRLFLN